MKTEELIAALDQISRINNDQWLESLSPRKISELEFHNRDRDKQFKELAQNDSDTYDKFYGNKKYYGGTQKSRQYVEEWIEKMRLAGYF